MSKERKELLERAIELNQLGIGGWTVESEVELDEERIEDAKLNIKALKLAIEVLKKERSNEVNKN